MTSPTTAELIEKAQALLRQMDNRRYEGAQVQRQDLEAAVAALLQSQAPEGWGAELLTLLDTMRKEANDAYESASHNDSFAGQTMAREKLTIVGRVAACLPPLPEASKP